MIIDVFDSETLNFVERMSLNLFIQKFKPKHINAKDFYRETKKAMSNGDMVSGYLVTPVETFEEVLLYETDRGWRYYAHAEKGFCRVAKNGSKKWLSVYKTKKKGRIIHLVKLGGKERNAARLMAKAFIKPDLDETYDVIVDGEFKLENIYVVNRHDNRSRTGKMAKVNKPIAQYKNNVEIKRWHSAYDCGKELGFSHQSIRDIVNKTYKNHWGLDLRYI